MSPDEPLPAAVADHDAIARRELAIVAARLVAGWRAQRTARPVLVLAFIAPVHMRKPAHSGEPPEGWTKCLIASHLLTDLNGVWWIPSGIVEHIARFTGVQ